MNLETVSILLVLAMVPFANAASIMYGLLFPWRRTREGWAFANVLWSFTVLIDAAVLYEFVPNFPGKSVVRVVVYAAILAGQVQLAYSLVRLVLRNRQRKKT